MYTHPMPNITIYANEADYKTWKTATRMIPGVSKRLLELLRRELPAMIEEEKKKLDMPID